MLSNHHCDSQVKTEKEENSNFNKVTGSEQHLLFFL